MNKQRIAVYVSLIVVFLLSSVIITNVFSDVRPSLAAIVAWVQTDWSGGVDGGIGASHSTDQIGWTKYASVNNVSGTELPGNAALSTVNFSATDDGILTTTGAASGGGFNNGALLNTSVSGNDAGASVTLTGTTIPVNTFESTMQPVPGLVSTGGSMVWDGGDDVYVLQGNSSTGFFRYSISADSWTTLASVPGTVGNGGVMLRGGLDNDIYVLRGGNNSDFFRYSISGGNWTTLTSIPGIVSVGASLMINGVDDDIYAVRGASNGFYKYSISGNSWTTLTVIPGSVGGGSAMLRNGADDEIYVSQGNGLTGFYKYSISGNAWAPLAVFPAGTGFGSIMIRNGSDDAIYALRANSNNTFYRYSVVGDVWTTLAVVPGFVDSGSSMIRNGADDHIYVLRGANTNGFYRYSIVSNTWTTLAVLPGLSANGGRMLRNAGGDDLYVLQGGATSGFHKYSIAGNTWLGSGVSPIALPAVASDGAYMIRNGSDDDIYVLRGASSTSFYKYSVSGNAWTALAPSPTTISTGSAMIRNGSDNDIYMLRGGGNVGFYKYSISADSWTTLATVPAGVGNGSTMLRNGSDDDIYVLRGTNTTGFVRYSISGDSWTTLTSVPGTVEAGGGMLRYGTEDEIYVLRGNNTTDFFKYSILGNSWTTLTAAPGTIFTGAKMLRNIDEDEIYVLRGNSNGFFRYSITGNSWETLASAPSNVGNGAQMLRHVSEGDLYVLAGSATRNFYKYTISGNTWTTLATVPNLVSNGGFMIRDGGDNQIFILQGNSSANLWRYTIDITTYPASGTFTSGVIDTSGTISFGNLSWTETVPVPATLTFATRSGDTAVPDGTWSDWSAELSNAAGSPITSPAARYVQYRGSFDTADDETTPTLSDFTVGYAGHWLSGDLVSSPFNSIDASNVIASLSWTEDNVLPSGTSVTVSLRTASTAGGLTGVWTDFTNATADCIKSSGLVACNAAAIPDALKLDGDDQYLQYKVAFTTTNTAVTPIVSSVDVYYGAASSSARKGMITIFKSVINDNGGAKSATDFLLFMNEVSVEDGLTYTIWATGTTYTITGTDDPAYQQMFSGDCDVNGNMILNPGDDKVCHVTYDDIGGGPSIVPHQPQQPEPPTPPAVESEIPESETLQRYRVAEALASSPTVDVDKGLVALPDSQSAPCVAGLLMKLPGDGNSATFADSTVYLCGVDGKRYPFPDEQTYFSWYTDFSDVQVFSTEDLASIPQGDFVTFRPGSRMLKLMSSSNVYAVAKGGVLRLVTSEDVARALYGAEWNTVISDVEAAVFESYIIGAPITLADAI